MTKTTSGLQTLDFENGDGLFFKNVRNEFKKLADIKGTNEGDISAITSLDEMLGLLKGFDSSASDRFSRSFDDEGRLVLSIGADAEDKVTLTNVQQAASGNRVEIGSNQSGTVNVLNGDVLFLGNARNAAGDLENNQFGDAPTLAQADEFYELIDEVLEGTAPIGGTIVVGGITVTAANLASILANNSDDDIVINFAASNAGPRTITIEGGFDALAIRDYLDDGAVSFNGTVLDINVPAPPAGI